MSARDDAVKAATSGLITLVQPDIEPTEIDEAEARAVAELVVDAVIPHLLAPLRELHHCVPMRAVEGYCPDCNVIWPCATVRLLDQIEGGESR